MFRNYLLIALRSINRNKLYAGLNIMGLTLGLSVSLLIMLFVIQERNFDRFHEKGDRIFQLSRLNLPANGADSVRYSTLPPALAPALAADFPAVKDYVRIQTRPRMNVARPAAADSTFAFIEPGVRFVDDSFFQVFSFRLLSGDEGSVLRDPMTVVLSEQMAEKYFGDADPVGEKLLFENEHLLTVTGIAAEPPVNSSITFDFLVSIESWPIFLPFAGDLETGWNSFAYETFLLMQPGTSINPLVEQLPDYVASRSSLAERQNIRVDRAEPLFSRYLHSRVFQNLLGPEGDPFYLYVFSVIALMVLLVASLNYMNLATARSFNRAREVGVRKAVGAGRYQVALQFLSEAVVMVFVSLPLSAGLIWWVIPRFNSLLQYQLDPGVLNGGAIVLFVALLAGLLGVISGSYPAMILSRVHPARILKGQTGGTGTAGTAVFRKGLIVFQFFISITLIAGTWIVHRQINLIKSSSYMEDSEQVISLNLFRFPGSAIPSLKQELQQLASVDHASVSFNIPFQRASSAGGTDNSYQHYYVDTDFVETYGLSITAGRDFSEAFLESDIGSAVVVNETAVRQFGIDDPVGQTVEVRNNSYRIVGVVDDFHYESLYEEIKPLVMELRPDAAAWLSLRISSGNIEQFLQDVLQVWHSFTGRGMEYRFMDESFESMYTDEKRLGELSGAFAFLAILIACLGVFGLSGYLAEQRTKELGIRKIFGASLLSLVKLLTRDYATLVVVAFLLSIPVTWLFMQWWLMEFVYRIEIGTGIFLLSGLAVLLVSMTAATWLAFRAASLNPAETLRE